MSMQGTAFKLHGIGFVTCSHVLARDSVAFRADEPSHRTFPIKVLKQDAAIDLAIIAI